MPNYIPHAIVFGLGSWLTFEIIKDERKDTQTPFWDLDLSNDLLYMLAGGATLTFIYTRFY